MYKGKGNEKKSAQYTLDYLMVNTLKLFAPIMPFITEEIYQDYFKKKEKDKSIHISSFPKVGKRLINSKKEKLGDNYNLV